MTQQDVFKAVQHTLLPTTRQLLQQRRKIGIAEYGTPLMTYNGRDALQDATEELADALIYLLQAMLEGDDVALQVGLCEALLNDVLKRKGNR